MPRPLFIVLLVLFILSVAACDSAISPTDLDPGTFTLRIDGEEEVLRSQAYYRSGMIQNVETFFIGLGFIPPEIGREESEFGVIELYGMGALPVGTINLSDIFAPEFDPEGIYAEYLIWPDSSSGASTYRARGGALTIERVIDGRLALGSFSITVDATSKEPGTFEPAGDPFVLEGTFSATYLEDAVWMGN